MKKIIAVIAVLALLVVSMAACSSKTDEIVTTNGPVAVETYEAPISAEITEVETAN